MKRPDVSVPSPETAAAPVDVPKLLKLCPHLADALLAPMWEDGTPKGSRALMAFVDDGAIRLLLKVESPSLKTSVAARTWDDVFAALEGCLRSGQVVWEQDNRPQTTPKKGRK